MSQPTPYTPTTDFSQQEANNAAGRSTVNTASLDAEFANVETTLDQTLANLALLQRDDGRLKDLATEVHTLSPEVLNLMGGFRLTGLWQAAEVYSVNDIASNLEYTYVCTTAHTSGGSFDGSYWTQFGFTGGGDAAQAAAEAAVSAANAAASAGTASTAASTATSAASTATTAASTATTQAGTATSAAGAASVSETNAANSAAAAAASAGSITYPIPVASGGTGSANASDARTALGVTPANIGALATSAVGTTVQAYDADTAKLDVAQQFTARQRTSPTTDNDLSLDLAAANDFVCTPTAGGTLTFTNITAGCKGEILLVNNSNYAIAKAAAVKCPSSMLTTISATGRYRLAYSSLDGTNVDVTNSAALA